VTYQEPDPEVPLEEEEPVAEGTPGGGEDQQQHQQQPPVAPSTPSPGPRLVQVGNVTLPEEEVLSLVEFQNWARSNPDKMEAFGEYLRGEAQFVKPERTKEPEVDWDLVDPTVRTVYETQQRRLEELQNRVDQVEAPMSQIQQDIVARTRQEVQQALDAATGRIADRFKLSDDEVEQLAGEAAGLNIVPSLRAQGMPPQAALETALETAFWRDEKWRKKVVDEEISSRTAEGRKARASQVGGTHAGADNGLDSQPRDEGERRKAMASEIAEALRGTP
jgi:DNA-binding transcriptional MerR regulator